MPVSSLGWPEPYLPDPDPTHSVPEPTWSKDQVIAAGLVLAQLFITDRAFADAYLAIVKRYYANITDPLLSNCTQAYRDLLVPRLSNVRHPASFNEHDFANLHRATWLYLLESFTCLVNKNPHGNWGDPSATSPVLRGDEGGDPGPGRPKCFHNIPNSTGYYALSSSDLASPAPTVTM